MFNNMALDVVIGLIFIFLLYSLLATVIQEIIATQLAFRAKVLEKAILRMLEDGKTTSRFPLYDRIRGLKEMLVTTNRLKNKKFAAAFYAHPLIKYLAEDNWHSKPAYLHAGNFSKIVVDLLHGIDQNPASPDVQKIQQSITNAQIVLPVIANPDKHHPACKALLKQKNEEAKHGHTRDINAETQLFLQSILNESGGDIAMFKGKLERWFDDTMERATGWYKRYTQIVLFGVGLAIAIIFNVDTIAIGAKLSHDPKLREQVVQNAGFLLQKEQEFVNRLQVMEKAGETNGQAYLHARSGYDSLQNRLQSLLGTADNMINEDIANASKIMGLGWNTSAMHAPFLGVPLKGFLCFKCNHIHTMNIIGWLITALAISLGSPFWFDLLNRVMSLRCTGSKIKSADAGTSPASYASASLVVPVNNKPAAGKPETMHPN